MHQQRPRSEQIPPKNGDEFGQQIDLVADRVVIELLYDQTLNQKSRSGNRN